MDPTQKRCRACTKRETAKHAQCTIEIKRNEAHMRMESMLPPPMEFEILMCEFSVFMLDISMLD